MHEPCSSSEQDETTAAQLPSEEHLAPSILIGWRPRVLFAFAAEEQVLSFSDVRGRLFRMKKAKDVDVYICELLREPRTVAHLLEQAQERYPRWPENRIYGLLKLLMARDLIEQKDTPPPSEISVEDQTLYDRQLRFFGLFAHTAQERFYMQISLKQATVTILGLGGVGTWVARNLAAMGVGHLRLVDYDLVELSNLNRQMLYTPVDLGQPKIEVATRVLKTAHPQLDVQAIPLKITSPEDIEHAIRGANMAVLTADKPVRDIRRWMTIACARQHLPYVQGSLDAYFLQIGPLYHVPYTGCYGCREVSMRQSQSYAAPTQASGYISRERPPLLGPLCGFVGSLLPWRPCATLASINLPAHLDAIMSSMLGHGRHR